MTIAIQLWMLVPAVQALIMLCLLLIALSNGEDCVQSVVWTCIGYAIWVLPVMLAVGLKQGGGNG